MEMIQQQVSWFLSGGIKDCKHVKLITKSVHLLIFPHVLWRKACFAASCRMKHLMQIIYFVEWRTLWEGQRGACEISLCDNATLVLLRVLMSLFDFCFKLWFSAAIDWLSEHCECSVMRTGRFILCNQSDINSIRRTAFWYRQLK